jgi:hypothetical protein
MGISQEAGLKPSRHSALHQKTFSGKKVGIQLNNLSEPVDPKGFSPWRQANGFPRKRGSLPIGKEICGLA